MTQLVFITSQEALEESLRKVLKELTPSKTEINPDERMDRRQAAKFLGVSYQTMAGWTKNGIIQEHGHGRKKFYLRGELIESMQIKS